MRPAPGTPPVSALDQYLESLGAYPPLPLEEQGALAVQAQGGDMDARDLLVSHSLRLVVAEAWRYQDLGVPLLDLIQEGTLGLMRAVQKYNPDKGTTFPTYARHWWIRRFLHQALADHGHLARVSRADQDRLLKLHRVEGALAQDLHADPPEEDVAEAMGESVNTVRRLRSLVSEVNLDDPAPAGGDQAPEVEPTHPPDDPQESLEREERNRLLQESLATVLDERSREAVVLYYGLNGQDPMTQAQVGDVLGVSQRWVSTLLTRALRSIRLALEEDATA